MVFQPLRSAILTEKIRRETFAQVTTKPKRRRDALSLFRQLFPMGDGEIGEWSSSMINLASSVYDSGTHRCFSLLWNVEKEERDQPFAMLGTKVVFSSGLFFECCVGEVIDETQEHRNISANGARLNLPTYSRRTGL